MKFHFPPNFNQLPPEIQENVRKSITQQCILNMHLGGIFLDAINNMALSINKIVKDSKYKDDPNISNLNKEIKEILGNVKEEMELCSIDDEPEED